MGTTAYNVSMINRRCQKETPEMILQILDEVQKIVYSQECLQTLKLTPTGMPPFIATQKGVFEYDCPDDCRNTSAIFTLKLPESHLRSRPVGPRREYYFRKKGYYMMSAESRPATIETPAKIYFQEDPGDTTEAYYHLYHLKPITLSTMDVQLILPEECHFLLREAVISMITSDEYGKSQFDEAIMAKVARKIRNTLNKGFFSGYGRTPVREEDQEIDGYSSGRGYL
jgi:hypothetical protein